MEKLRTVKYRIKLALLLIVIVAVVAYSSDLLSGIIAEKAKSNIHDNFKHPLTGKASDKAEKTLLRDSIAKKPSDKWDKEPDLVTQEESAETVQDKLPDDIKEKLNNDGNTKNEKPDDKNTKTEKPDNDKNTKKEKPNNDDNTKKEKLGNDDNTKKEKLGNDDNTKKEKLGNDGNIKKEKLDDGNTKKEKLDDGNTKKEKLDDGNTKKEKLDDGITKKEKLDDGNTKKEKLDDDNSKKEMKDNDDNTKKERKDNDEKKLDKSKENKESNKVTSIETSVRKESEIKPQPIVTNQEMKKVSNKTTLHQTFTLRSIMKIVGETLDRMNISHSNISTSDEQVHQTYHLTLADVGSISKEIMKHNLSFVIAKAVVSVLSKGGAPTSQHVTLRNQLLKVYMNNSQPLKYAPQENLSQKGQYVDKYQRLNANDQSMIPATGRNIQGQPQQIYRDQSQLTYRNQPRQEQVNKGQLSQQGYRENLLHARHRQKVPYRNTLQQNQVTGGNQAPREIENL